MALSGFLNAALGAPAELKQDGTLKGVDVVLVVGSDFAGVHALGTAATAGTSTTSTTAGNAGGNATGKSAADSC